MAYRAFLPRHQAFIVITYIIDVRIRQNINDIYNKIPEALRLGDCLLMHVLTLACFNNQVLMHARVCFLF